jgi:eukaryotic-like serine/threonine-protein kinase
MSRCIADEQFQRLLSDQLSEAERQALEAHVDSCGECQERLARLLDGPGDNDTVANWRLLCRPPATPTAEPVEDLLRRLRNNPPSLPPTTPGPGDAKQPPAILFPDPPTARGPLGRLESYHVVAELGRGAFGLVFKAYDERLDRVVALKVLRPELAAGANDRARFEGEARKAATVRHDHVVTIHRVGGTPGFALPYFVMEFVDGEALSDRLQRQGALGPKEAAEIARQVALGLAAAHARGLVHRDIKPANVLLEGPSGRVKITDFGLARNLEVGPEQLTQIGAIVGTPLYMSPEQIMTPARIDARSDVYSLGVVLYEMLTGELPFRGLTRLVLQQAVHEEPRPPRRLNDTIPRDLETVCLKCLRKDPATRYAAALDLADDLGLFLAGQPVTARPVSRGERVAYWCRRHPAAAALAVVSLFAVAALGAGVAGLLSSSHLQTLNGNLQAQTEEAEKQRHAAEEAGAETEQQRDLAQHYLYVADTNLADRARQEGRLGRALELLESHRPTPLQPRDRRGFEWYYLLRVCRDGQFSLPGGGTGLAFSPDGKRLATAGGSLKVWDAATGKEILTLRGGAGTGVAFSPDGTRLASAFAGGLQVWDAETGKELLTLKGGAGTGVAFSPDGKRLVSAGAGGLKVWDATNGQVLRAFPLEPTLVPRHGMAFSPDGKRLAAISGKTVEVWDLTGGGKPITLQGHTQFLNGLAFSPDGQRLASVGGRAEGHIPFEAAPGELKMWDVTSGQEIFSRLDPDGLHCVAFSPHGHRLATGGHGAVVRVWDADEGQEILALPGHTREVTDVAFAPDGKRLASVGLDQTVQVRNLSALEPWGLEHAGQPVWCVAFSPDGRRLASGTNNGIDVWDVPTGDTDPDENVRHIYSRAGACRRLAWSPDGRLLAAQGKVWDSTSRREIAALKARSGDGSRSGAGVAFSPDGKRVASAWHGVNVCDAQTGEEIVALQAQSSQIVIDSLAFSPDGRLLASGAENGDVKAWDAATGRLVLTYSPGAGHPVHQVAFSPDGQRLAAASVNSKSVADPGQVRIWEVATGREVFSLKGHTEAVWSVAFSSDGTRLATGSGVPWNNQTRKEGEIKVWDALTGQELLTLQNKRCVYAVAFSPDGRRLASAGADNLVNVWGAPPTGPD